MWVDRNRSIYDNRYYICAYWALCTRTTNSTSSFGWGCAGASTRLLSLGTLQKSFPNVQKHHAVLLQQENCIVCHTIPLPAGYHAPRTFDLLVVLLAGHSGVLQARGEPLLLPHPALVTQAQYNGIPSAPGRQSSKFHSESEKVMTQSHLPCFRRDGGIVVYRKQETVKHSRRMEPRAVLINSSQEYTAGYDVEKPFQQRDELRLRFLTKPPIASPRRQDKPTLTKLFHYENISKKINGFLLIYMLIENQNPSLACDLTFLPSFFLCKQLRLPTYTEWCM